MNNDDDDHHHKLCGYLYVVVNQQHDVTETLLFSTPLTLTNGDGDVSFVADNGVKLSPLTNCEPENGGLKKMRRIGGLVNGRLSVVDQLHVMNNSNCAKIKARVICVDNRRVVVLVDVYLPVDVWSGWQFPQSSKVAAALFKHLSYDWDERSSMLAGNVNGIERRFKNSEIWNVSDCHVVGCKLCHGISNSSSKKRSFELDEIFKSIPSSSVASKENFVNFSFIKPDGEDRSRESGIWNLVDDILRNKILVTLNPRDLISVAGTCRHLRSLTASIMPCLKLKLFQHQEVAVEWMLQREKNAQPLAHPLYKAFSTEDGFVFYINAVNGHIVTGTGPKVRDFRGGMFCDEPGLGKTITALSLILKTQGKMADPPDEAQTIWCDNPNGNRKCGYYELSGDNVACTLDKNKRRKRIFSDNLLLSPKKARLMDSAQKIERSSKPSSVKYSGRTCSEPSTAEIRCTRSLTLSGVKKDLSREFHEESDFDKENNIEKKQGGSYNRKRRGKTTTGGIDFVAEDNWVQCDACHKWRKIVDPIDAESAWFCTMNTDPARKSCRDPEESFENCESITNLLGFCPRGSSEPKEENVSFFISVLKEHYALITSVTRNALAWLTKLSPDELSKMETIGLTIPSIVLGSQVNSHGHNFHQIFRAFGLVKSVERRNTKWYYHKKLKNLVFDLPALRIALCQPLDSVRLYLSKATLIVVPVNLVDHWKMQIQKHVKQDQLRIFVWTDNQKPSPHSLAWDFDIVITTFNRLSAEWSKRKSALIQVHWLRIMLDEGHTLGGSFDLSNKLQMVVSLTASNRWILTGTPTPNTPNSQVSNLKPMLKFLHEEIYGLDKKFWEASIVKPFEAEMEEGKARLLDLLRRTYNELVETVLRNILLADWKDPSHVESLLNPKQHKFRSTTIRNIRLSCCVAGNIKVVDAGTDIQETMDLLVENGLDPKTEKYAMIKYNILYGCNCHSEKCTLPGCGNLYEMQSPETLARPENPNPKWPVPKDLIELQPSYKQDDWNPDWQSTSSSKVAYLVEKLKILQETNQKNSYSMEEDRDAMQIIHTNDSSEWLQQDYFRFPNQSQKKFPEKVLIFSQFLEHINSIEEQLKKVGVSFAPMYSPMPSSIKAKSLAKFQYDDSCLALLMDGSAALGLDLSFVNHVFLMEPLWDRSMEEQVISRAHRMGATRPINVETLVMRGTIEEQMMKFLQDTSEGRRFMKDEIGKSDKDGRSHRTLHDFAQNSYLADLHFVR
ncbi:hypothetical protein ACFE04_010770 [Oxalis oulophora]